MTTSGTSGRSKIIFSFGLSCMHCELSCLEVPTQFGWTSSADIILVYAWLCLYHGRAVEIMNATAIKYILISVKTIDTILTFALFYCEWKDINDDDGIIHGMVMASIISRAVLNSCVFKPNTNYALKYFGQALQFVPIGLLIAAIVICIIRNRYIGSEHLQVQNFSSFQKCHFWNFF